MNGVACRSIIIMNPIRIHPPCSVRLGCSVLAVGSLAFTQLASEAQCRVGWLAGKLDRSREIDEQIGRMAEAARQPRLRLRKKGREREMKKRMTRRHPWGATKKRDRARAYRSHSRISIFIPFDHQLAQHPHALPTCSLARSPHNTVRGVCV